MPRPACSSSRATARNRLSRDGEKSFVAGADISEMAHLDEPQGFEFGRLGAQVFRAIETLPIPVIAAVNGFALGGGCELAMACDIRIASSKAKFGQPEVGLGIIPGFSGTHRLPKLIGQGYAKEMIYTGKVIRADEALRIGLVNAVYEPEELMGKAMEMAQMMLKNAPVAISLAKQSISRTLPWPSAWPSRASTRAMTSMPMVPSVWRTNFSASASPPRTRRRAWTLSSTSARPIL